jgi:hypothetical protein
MTVATAHIDSAGTGANGIRPFALGIVSVRVALCDNVSN